MDNLSTLAICSSIWIACLIQFLIGASNRYTAKRDYKQAVFEWHFYELISPSLEDSQRKYIGDKATANFQMVISSGTALVAFVMWWL